MLEEIDPVYCHQTFGSQGSGKLYRLGFPTATNCQANHFKIWNNAAMQLLIVPESQLDLCISSQLPEDGECVTVVSEEMRRIVSIRG